VSTETGAEEGGATPLREIQEALRSHTVRVEFGPTFSMSQGVLPTATIYLPGETPRAKWRQVGPMLLPAKDGTRADLLDLLRHLLDPPAVDRG
jgi:hypothetical protein